MQEKALSEDGKYFLAGSTLPPWRAVSLRNLWAEAEIVEFLKTGGNSHAMAYGSMTEVVHNSTQYFSDADLQAVAHYLKSLSPGAGAPAAAPEATAAHEPADGLYSTRGGLGYAQFCASCHRRDGQGAAEVFPPLAHNESVLSDDPTSVIHIALTGWTAAETKHKSHAFSMPEYSSLSDEELADILSFVRTSWGNRGSPVTPKQVQAMRRELEPLSSAPARFAAPRFSAMLSSVNADQLVLGMRLMTETKDLLPENVGDVLNCTSCHLNGGTVANASPFVGLTAIFPVLFAKIRARHIDGRSHQRLLPTFNEWRAARERFQGNAGDGGLHGLDEGRRQSQRQNRGPWKRQGGPNGQTRPGAGPNSL